MSLLHVVRHAQASFFGDDYDVLSDLGREQAAALGRAWARAGMRLDRVLIGPRRRHRHTASVVGDELRRAGLPWPEPDVVAAFDEHQGPLVVERELGPPPARDDDQARRKYFRDFQDVTERWIRGLVRDMDDLESWAAFRSRIDAGLDAIVGQDGGGGVQVAVFTSGGPMAAAVGRALDLDDTTVLGLAWRIRNTSISELLFSGGRLALHTFNTIGHLDETRLVTYV